MRAYLINVTDKSVTEVELDKEKANNGEAIREQIDARYFTLVYLNDRQDAVYVDDEGLINGTMDRLGMFVLTSQETGRAVPLAGHGLVMGHNPRSGNSRDPQITLDQLQAMVSFPTVSEIRMRASRGEFD